MPQWFLVSGLTVLLAFLFGKAFVSAQKQYAKEQQLLEEEAAAGMSGIAEEDAEEDASARQRTISGTLSAVDHASALRQSRTGM